MKVSAPPKKLKMPFHGHIMLLVILMVRNCSNVLLKQSRVIKRNGGKWKSYDKSFISWIDKKDIYKRVFS